MMRLLSINCAMWLSIGNLIPECSEPDPIADGGMPDTEMDTSGTDNHANPLFEKVFQPPVTITIVNNTSRIAYIDDITPVRAEYNIADLFWVETNLEPPFCTMACDDPIRQMVSWTCCIECSRAAAVLGILPGDTITYEWDGYLHMMNYLSCLCGCHYPTYPYIGEYRIHINVFDEVYCFDRECPSYDESGVWYNMEPDGASSRFQTVFEVPVEGAGPTIEITDER